MLKTWALFAVTTVAMQVISAAAMIVALLVIYVGLHFAGLQRQQLDSLGEACGYVYVAFVVYVGPLFVMRYLREGPL